MEEFVKIKYQGTTVSVSWRREIEDGGATYRGGAEFRIGGIIDEHYTAYCLKHGFNIPS